MRSVVRKLSTFALAFAALGYLTACVLLYSGQRSMLYHPTPRTGAQGARELMLPSQGETLRILVRESAGPRAVIYFGGNGESVANNMQWLPYITDAAIYLVNYRGYGGSTGEPGEAALFADALAVYDHVKAAHPRVSVIGRSLGSGVAMYLASERPVQKLVLVTPYDSILNIARERYPWVPVSLVLRDRFDSASRARKVSAPVLLLLAEVDDVIARGRSQALLAAFAPNQAQAVILPRTGHNTISASVEYPVRIGDFLRGSG